jgi:UDP-N-acetylmuramoylalanine--D-glutamate ligase
MIAMELNTEVECLESKSGYSLVGKKVLVVGLGGSGLSAVDFLLGRGARVTATDNRAEGLIEGVCGLRETSINLELGGHELDSFLSADLIVLSPGVPPTIVPIASAIEKGVEVVSDIELFSRFASVPIIAITGTNGKSTTTVLLGEVLRLAGREAFVGGNIGKPALDYFKEYQEGKEADCAVLEISSFHLEQVSSFRPKVAVLLNITEDHLDRYNGFEDYAQTKFRIFKEQEASDFAVINIADEVIARGLKEAKLKSKVIAFSSESKLDDGFYLNKKGDDVFIVRTHGKEGKEKKEYSLEGVCIKGTHNAENIMAVMAIAEAMGIDNEVAVKAARSFKGLAHRMEFVKNIDGVDYINDSKSTNAGSLYKALVGMQGAVVLIAGGRDKGGDYCFLKGLVREKVQLMLVIGEAKERLQEAFGSETKVVCAASLEQAVGLAKQEASKGTVLFSPACSSFDMFRNFRERGAIFKELVEAL